VTLTDPHGALGDQSSFIDYLMGLAGIGRFVRTLTVAGRGSAPTVGADDFTFLLLGLASVGAAIERLNDIGAPTPEQPTCVTRWLR
jgi:hypothetical protein